MSDSEGPRFPVSAEDFWPTPPAPKVRQVLGEDSSYTTLDIGGVSAPDLVSLGASGPRRKPFDLKIGPQEDCLLCQEKGRRHCALHCEIVKCPRCLGSGSLTEASLTRDEQIQEALLAEADRGSTLRAFIAKLEGEDKARSVEEAGREPEPHARVGVAVLVRDRDGRLLMQLRKGSHGADTYSVPGGHLDVSDASPAEAAARELCEESGLVVRADHLLRIPQITYTHFPEIERSYVTLYFHIDLDVSKPQVELKEPDKCRSQLWVGKDYYQAFMGPNALFAPLQNLLQLGVDPWTVGRK